VTGEAIRALTELHRQDRRASFFVNICPAVLRDPDFLVTVQKQLREAGMKPQHLIFEADESALTAYPAEADAFLKAARKIGCRFTIDNFGHNLNTLELVRELSVDFVKIAGAHIHNLSSDPVTQTSLKALVQVAKAIDKKVIAKSVEKAEDLAILWNLGIDYVQGNYFQGADDQPDYEFASETTLSSDTAAPNWASGGNGR
jgi:EAL domain-containing protein (putative c-di-GMP-specific phosphodiesterase class I)